MMNKGLKVVVTHLLAGVSTRADMLADLEIFFCPMPAFLLTWTFQQLSRYISTVFVFPKFLLTQHVGFP